MRLRPSGLLLPGLSGILLALSLPPHPLPLLAPVALAPLGLYLLRLGPGGAGAIGAARAGAVTGGVSSLLTLHWIPAAATPLLGWPAAVPAGLAVWGAAAAFTAAGTWLVHRTARRGRLPLPVAMGAVWVLLGWLPAALPVAGLPWLGPEAALVRSPLLLSVSDLVGGAGLGGLLAVSGGAGALLLERADRRALAWTAGVALLGGGAAIYGLVAAAVAAEGEGLRVAALSLEADAELLSQREKRMRELPVALIRLSGLLRAGEVDVVMWPESPSGEARLGLEEAGAREMAERLGVPVLFGAMARVREGGRRNRFQRARPDGSVEVLHEKRRLVPAVEWRFPGKGGGVEAGPPRPPFPVGGAGGITAGALVCFEALFAGEGRRLRRQGARVLLLPANEGWLAPPGGGWFDAGRAQHRAAAVLRAVELRVPVIRSAVGGPAGLWNARGRPVAVEERGPAGVGRVLVGTVRPGARRAPLAARGGAGAVVLLAAAVLALAAVERRGALRGYRLGEKNALRPT